MMKSKKKKDKSKLQLTIHLHPPHLIRLHAVKVMERVIIFKDLLITKRDNFLLKLSKVLSK